MPGLNQTRIAQPNAIEQQQSRVPPMTSKGPDGRANKTVEMEDRANDADNDEHNIDAVPPSVSPSGPPD